MKISQLTHSEEVLMQIMWKLKSAPLKEILVAYPEPKPHQNTVSTFVKILTEKKFLSVVKEGRIFRYEVAVPRNSYRLFLLQNLLAGYFENSGDELINTLTENGLWDSEENSSLPREKEVKEEKAVSDFINEITGKKKQDKKEKKKKKKKNK